MREKLENSNDDGGGNVEQSRSRGIAEAGHAYQGQELAGSFNIHSGQDLFAPPKKDDKVDQYDTIDRDKDVEREVRKRRKEARAQKRREKEEHYRRKEERKRQRHDRHN